MNYTEEEINKYLNILSNYNKSMQQFTTKSKCRGCPNTEFLLLILASKSVMNVEYQTVTF